MGKLRQTALILGEGPTEFFYFKSLCDVFKRLTIILFWSLEDALRKELDIERIREYLSILLCKEDG